MTLSEESDHTNELAEDVFKDVWKTHATPQQLRDRIRHALAVAYEETLMSRDISLLEGTGFEEFVRRHVDEASRGLESGSPEEVASRLEEQVNFCVYPINFADSRVRFVGGYRTKIRTQETVALEYEVSGAPLKVLITEELTSPTDVESIPVGSSSVPCRRVDGRLVPVMRLGNWTYLFSGSPENADEVLALAAEATIDW